jgi:hypothetical protein
VIGLPGFNAGHALEPAKTFYRYVGQPIDEPGMGLVVYFGPLGSVQAARVEVPDSGAGLESEPLESEQDTYGDSRPQELASSIADANVNSQQPPGPEELEEVVAEKETARDLLARDTVGLERLDRIGAPSEVMNKREVAEPDQAPVSSGSAN